MCGWWFFLKNPVISTTDCQLDSSQLWSSKIKDFMLPLSPWRGSKHARFTMWELTNAPARFQIGRANCSPVKEFAAVQVNISLDFDLSCPKNGSGVFLTVPAMLGLIFRSMVLVVVTKSMKTSSRVFTVWARTCRSLEPLLRVVRRRCCYRTLCQTLNPALANLAELPFACSWTDPTSSKWRGLCGERALTYMGCFQVEAPVWQCSILNPSISRTKHTHSRHHCRRRFDH